MNDSSESNASLDDENLSLTVADTNLHLFNKFEDFYSQSKFNFLK